MTVGWLSRDLDLKIAAQLKHYFKKEVPPAPLPFITISRELGCNGKLLSEILCKKLNEIAGEGEKSWEVFGKTTLRENLDQLHLEKETLRMLDEYGHSNFSSFIQDTLLGKPHQFETIKKIGKLERLMASEGNVILLGSGATVLTHDMRGGIHVRLYAGLEWRIQNYAKRHKTPLEQARKEVTDKANQRESFVKTYLARDIGDRALYHAMFNNEYVSEEEVANWIMKHMKK